ncbi:hypothetical protein CLOM_g24148 [Closterium sp. NIES-68]|nr:hypothetical protein CLOM_g24148 [Closterium sp. NIES-68]GJP74113.1 hypothetical protein CLOP_g4747 [Closterium sp. NIES-67]
MANYALADQLRRAQLAAAAATRLTPSTVPANASAAALIAAQQSLSGLAVASSMNPAQQQWEQQQRQMLLLLLQQQRQQNAQLYMHRMALLSSASNHCRMQQLQQNQQQQQQITAIASMISTLKSSINNAAVHIDSPAASPAASEGISIATPDLNLASMNLAPVSSAYEDSADSGASPTWTSPRAVHEFSASWGSDHDHDAYDCHEESAVFESAGVADSPLTGVPALLPLPSEEEFDSHLVAVQSSYVDQ